MKRLIEELHLLIGLPGAGKTFFANQLKQDIEQDSFFPKTNIIDFDLIHKEFVSKFKNFSNDDSTKEFFENKIKDIGACKITIVDGFFPTNKDQEYILNLFMKLYQIKKVIIHYWYPDKEICIKNDKGRRSQDSYNTIMNTDLQQPDINKIKSDYDYEFTVFKLERHYTVLKPDWASFFEKIENIYYDKINGVLHSCDWLVSGEWWSYTGSRGSYTSEEPLEFNEFDNLLEKICPNLSFLQYRDIRNKCVTLKERYNRDYYSTTTNNYWECDLKKLYDLLVEKNLIFAPEE